MESLIAIYRKVVETQDQHPTRHWGHQQASPGLGLHCSGLQMLLATLKNVSPHCFAEQVKSLCLFWFLFFLKGDAGFSLCWWGRSQSHWWESPVSHGHALVR